MGARAAGFGRLIVPCGNVAEAALVDDIEVVGVPSLARLVGFLHGRWVPDPPALHRPPRVHRGRIWPTCAVRPMPAARSRSPPRAATTC